MLLGVGELNAHYGKKQVLDRLAISVTEGEVVALIGPNAAGKSTTMRCILGLKQPSGGAISFMGQRIDTMGTAQRVRAGLVLVPEGRQVFTKFTVLENLLMGAYHRPDRAHVGDDLKLMFALFPRLEERRTQKAGSMSGGEQQILAIARGLMSRPKLLLMDEPSLGLAPIVMEEIAHSIRTLSARGLSILVAEQNASFALRMADKGYVIESGTVALGGDASSLSKEPRVRQNYLGQ